MLQLLRDVSDEVINPRFRDLAAHQVSEKNPGDLVTVADHEAEVLITAALTRAYPDAVVLGEEAHAGDPGLLERYAAADHAFTVDPVDGTKNFVRGVPVWATLIALQEEGEVTVGVVSAPALGRRWWAARGLGAHTGGALAGSRPLRVSQVAGLADASVAYSSLTGWEEQGRLPGLLQLSRDVWRTRAYGDFWSHVLVAEGAVDASFEPEVSLWDLAALHVVVEEAGGRFTDLAGTRGPAGGSVVCSNGLLHDDVLTALQVSARS